MSRYKILMHLRDNPEKWLTIKELSFVVAVSVRNVRRSVISLEADKWLLGRCRGNYKNWNREFKINVRA